MQISQDVITVLRQKFPDGAPDVYSLSEEQKAWLQIKIQLLADGTMPSRTVAQLQKIGKRLSHATEDIPDGEMQRMVSFVFENIDEIENVMHK